MKLSPWLFGLLLCCYTLCQPVTARAADWVSVGETTAQLAKSPLKAVTFDPKRSVAEFNQQQASRDPASQLQIAIEIPRDRVSLRNIAQRPIRFDVAEGVYFTGKVTAAFLKNSRSKSVLVHATLENRREGGEWQLKPGTTGTLSIRP